MGVETFREEGSSFSSCRATKEYSTFPKPGFIVYLMGKAGDKTFGRNRKWRNLGSKAVGE
jgi:hypothetical protein